MKHPELCNDQKSLFILSVCSWLITLAKTWRDILDEQHLGNHRYVPSAASVLPSDRCMLSDATHKKLFCVDDRLRHTWRPASSLRLLWMLRHVEQKAQPITPSLKATPTSSRTAKEWFDGREVCFYNNGGRGHRLGDIPLKVRTSPN